MCRGAASSVGLQCIQRTREWELDLELASDIRRGTAPLLPQGKQCAPANRPLTASSDLRKNLSVTPPSPLGAVD